MAQRSARQTALAALLRWRKEKNFADSIISGLLDNTSLIASDRAFALDLFYGVLRHLTLLDFWIGRLRTSRIETSVRDILRLGLYQIFLLRTPDHAAVHETVATAASKQRTIINAVLRTAITQRSELLAQAREQPLFVQTSHPQFLVERWQKRFGAEDTEELCKWNNRPPPVYARINLIKIDHKSFARLHPDSRPLAGNPDFAEFDTLPMAALNSGHCYIQDPSTAIACQLLEAKPGETILDACAAPGGKTAYLAQFMENKGVIVACDRDNERLQILKDNANGLGATIVRPVYHDWRRTYLPDEIASIAPFDRVLLDAPCTNTGVMRRRIDVRWRLLPEHFRRMSDEQVVIARAVLRLLKPGGILVYSTCSLEPEENEHVARQLLTDVPALAFERQEYSTPFRNRIDGAFAARFRTAVRL